MFTGLVEEVGRLSEITSQGGGMLLFIECKTVREGMKLGDSIAVDGCCLTAVSLEPHGFAMWASQETLKKTTLGDRHSGDAVNLERALSASARLGGHMVSGHVDTTGTFLSANAVGDSHELRISAPPQVIAQCIPKGSIAIDGISLTIVDLTADEVSAWLIPETWERTTLRHRRPGDRVNLETDMVGKYVLRFLEQRFGSVDDAASRDARLADLLSQRKS